MIDRFYRFFLVSGSINEFPFWEAIFLGSQKLLTQGVFPSTSQELVLQYSKQYFSHRKVFGRLWQLPLKIGGQ